MNTDTKTSFPLPTVHLNGTGKATLQVEYREVWEAVREVQRLLALATCHGRDYYVQEDPDAIHKALEARREQFAHLHAVEEYCEAHLAHLDYY